MWKVSVDASIASLCPEAKLAWLDEEHACESEQFWVAEWETFY